MKNQSILGALDRLPQRLLRRVGLERRSSVLRTTLASAALLAAGAGVGASIALVLAPKLGKDVRSEIARGYARLTSRDAKPTDALVSRAAAASQVAAHPGRVPVDSIHVSNS